MPATCLLLQLIQLLLCAAVGVVATCIGRQLWAHRLQLLERGPAQGLSCGVVGAAERVAVGAVAADAVGGTVPGIVHPRAPGVGVIVAPV